MTILDGEGLSDIFGPPVEEILALPSLILDDLARGQDFIDGLISGTPPQRRPVIHIPAWDEVIHIVPENFLPSEEQQARRRDRARRIADSPTPESVRAASSILTWVDDVQDALVTASVLARLVATFYKPALPVAVVLQEAAAAANLFQLSASVPAITLAGKFRGQRIIPSLLGAQSARAIQNARINRVAPSIGEIIQIAQTTDQLFGVGLSLGPIVGFVQDLVFGSLTGAEFAFQSGIRYKPNDELFLRREDQDRAEGLGLHRHLSSVASGATAAAWLLSLPDSLLFSDRIDSLVLLSLIAELARGFLPESNWEPLALPGLDRDRPASRQLRPKTALSLYTLGLDPYQLESYPTNGNPTHLSPRQQANALVKAGPANISTWLAQAPNPTARLFAEQLATDLPFRMIRAFEGPGAAFQVRNTPPWRATIDSLELGLTPPLDATQDQARAYIAAATALYEIDPDRPTPIHDLRALHKSHFPPTGK